MKNLIKLFVLLLILSIVLSCEKDQDDLDLPIEKGKIIDTLIFDGVERSYMVYVPQSYDEKQAFPLQLNFHPLITYDSILYSVIEFTDFDELSEKENFILVAPKAAKGSDGRLRWNVDWDDDLPDDISFVNSLIDTICSKYNIDEKRIYATGYSQGAFMSFALACDLSERIAAIAGSAGYLAASYVPNPPYNGECNPSRPIAVLQIHGSYDPVVPYIGVQQSLDVWINHNQSTSTPIIDSINININDGQWIKHYLYPDGEQGTVVEHMKVVGANHDYSNFDGSKDIKDIEEFWKFVSQYDLNGKIE